MVCVIVIKVFLNLFFFSVFLAILAVENAFLLEWLHFYKEQHNKVSKSRSEEENRKKLQQKKNRRETKIGDFNHWQTFCQFGEWLGKIYYVLRTLFKKEKKKDKRRNMIVSQKKRKKKI